MRVGADYEQVMKSKLWIWFDLKWWINWQEKECASRRFLHDIVYPIVWIFLYCTEGYVRDVHMRRVRGYSKSVGSGTYLQIPLKVSCGFKRSSAWWCAGYSTWECQYWHMTHQPCVRIWICSFWKQIHKIRWCLSVTIVHQWLDI
jgi:hypothetical protein